MIPVEKARMTRAGGACPVDGTRLDFDPFQPGHHRCPRCMRVFSDNAHYRSWIMWYQLWLAERSVHSALLALLCDGMPDASRLRGFALSVLDGYSARYPEYPNRDNVLGPTRPFFSTYLESIWLLQLSVAADLLEMGGSSSAVGESCARLRDRVIAPSARLIASFDEGLSNRQVWHNAALLAAGRMLGDDRLATRAIDGPSGLARHLRDGLLADGTWYEGENYHLLAHRGLWYSITMAERCGLAAAIPQRFMERFREGFATPFLSALPDFTLPSRRDSHYAISLRQWRFSELCELGLACGDDPRLGSALHELYDNTLARGDTGRARSAAEAERNLPATGLGREDLGWRSLMHALPELPRLDPVVPRSVLLGGQGLAIMRRDAGRVYAALDYGHTGAGHGHPDRLGVLLSVGPDRWLDDPGTGSYVDRTLHWYRSTLAHNAPLVNGRSQSRAAGELRAFDERGGAGWVDAVAPGVAPGVELTRTLVMMPNYMVDRLAWRASSDVQIDLPIHVDGELVAVARGSDVAKQDLTPDSIDGELTAVGRWTAGELAGAGGLDDGFDFVHDAERANSVCDAVVRLGAERAGSSLDAWIIPANALDVEWWRALAPGPPCHAERRFHLARMSAASGEVTTVLCWSGAVAGVERAGATLGVLLSDGSRHEHARTGAGGWRIALTAQGASSSIDLGGIVPRAGGHDGANASKPRMGRPTPSPEVTDIVRDRCLMFTLGESSYRRSEQSWAESGAPSATVGMLVSDNDLVIVIRVRKTEPRFAPAGTVNELDNEHPDTNSDGIQLYVRPGNGRDDETAQPPAWLLVPEAAPQVRVTPVAGSPTEIPLMAEWQAAPDGFAVRCSVPVHSLGAHGRFSADVIVNILPPGRERRGGQLVMSGGGGFVYLRGDRQGPGALVPFRIVDV